MYESDSNVESDGISVIVPASKYYSDAMAGSDSRDSNSGVPSITSLSTGILIVSTVDRKRYIIIAEYRGPRRRVSGITNCYAGGE